MVIMMVMITGITTITMTRTAISIMALDRRGLQFPA